MGRLTEQSWRRFSDLARDLFAIELGAEVLRRLASFADLLAAWSVKMNLISVSSPQEILERHLLDSLAAGRFLEHAQTVADLGSGAGLPAVPLAILLPGPRFQLIESRRKRCSFLRNALRTLPVANAEVWECRAETWQPREPVDSVIGRALRDDILVDLAGRILRPGGQLLMMRKGSAGAPRADGFTTRDELCYRLPTGEDHKVVRLERIP